MNQSEIARLREQIELQMQAMQQGLRGLASGTSRHAFIRARMQRIEEFQGILAKQIGEEEADQVIYDLYSEVLKQ
jgi:hypothetical protein